MAEDRDTKIHNVLSSAGSIYRMRGSYKFILLWSAFASIWIIAMAILIGLFIFLPKTLDTAISGTIGAITLFLGLPILALSFITIYVAYKGYGRFNNFIFDFYPIWLSMRLDLSIPDGNDLSDKLAEMIKGAFPRFKKSTRIESTTNIDRLKNYDVVLKRKKEIAISKIIAENEYADYMNWVVSRNRKFFKKLSVKLMIIVIRDFSDQSLLERINSNTKLMKETSIVVMGYKDDLLSILKITPPATL